MARKKIAVTKGKGQMAEEVTEGSSRGKRARTQLAEVSNKKIKKADEAPKNNANDQPSTISVNAEASDISTTVFGDSDASTSLGIDTAVAPVQKVKPKKKSSKKKRPLTQTTINAGQKNPVITCSVCQFVYNKSLKEDRDKHEDFCEAFTGPVVAGKLNFNGVKAAKKDDFIVTVKREHWDEHKAEMVTDYVRTKGFVLAIDLHCSPQFKSLAKKALDKIEYELGAAVIDKEQLWSVFKEGVNAESRTRARFHEVARFKLFLAVVPYLPKHKADEKVASGLKVASVLVAESVKEGKTVEFPACTFDGYTSDYFNSDEEHVRVAGIEKTHVKEVPTNEPREVKMGVHYIWTHGDYCRRGLARYLVDHARHGHFIKGHQIHRDEIAWTQLTENGKNFACAFTTKQSLCHARDWSLAIYESK